MSRWRDAIPAGAWPASMPADMAAAYLGLSRATLAMLVASGQIPPPKAVRNHLGRTVKSVHRRADLDAWLDSPGLDGPPPPRLDGRAAGTLASAPGASAAATGEDSALSRLDRAYPD